MADRGRHDGPSRGATNGAPEPDPSVRIGQLRKLRVFSILAGLLVLAGASTVFGMMMAVAQDLPALEAKEEYKRSRNSIVLDVHGRKIATLTGNRNRLLLDSDEIPQIVKQSVLAIEDRRFYEHEGIDYRGIARALLQDVRRQSAVQGGSTITQQFVKNAVDATAERTVLQKLREAALAYNLERKWSKDKILTQYLNTIYFGEGAYGIGAAARTYFGAAHPGCGEQGNPPCSTLLQPHEAALLAGIIASPSRYSPRQNPSAALARRNTVLEKLREQNALSETEYREARDQALPAGNEIRAPREDSKAPYFTSWMRQHVVDRYGAGRAFAGGLRIRSTLDLDLQKSVEQAVNRYVGSVGPTAAAVVVDNKTGGVRAMYGGSDFRKRPFNLAVSAHRQPGSAFKPFTLITALERGISPNRTFSSRKKLFDVPNSRNEKFVVNNYNNNYYGAINLANATWVSDNSVYAELGLEVGTREVARTARRMGIQTNVSTNPAMTLGGLKVGVTPLEMAHAYQTLARRGNLTSGSLASGPGRPVSMLEVRDTGGDLLDRNEVNTEQVVKQGSAQQAAGILQGVVGRGTGKRAAYGGFAAGKTGTTENNGDAWFVGFTDRVTIAVWVGYADKTRPMETEFNGGPVDGGTFPALIWHDIAVAHTRMADRRRELAEARRAAKEGTSTAPVPAAPAPPVAEPEPEAPAREPAPEQQRPPQPQGGEQRQPPTPATPPQQQAPPAGGATPQQTPPQ